MRNILFPVAAISLLYFFGAGCSATRYLEDADHAAYGIIEQKQREALGRTEPFTVETPEDMLRRRLLIEQDLPYAGPASLGSDYLLPVDRLPGGRTPAATVPEANIQADSHSADSSVTITIVEALQIAAHNSREYQTRKEDLFRKALDLDFERVRFRNTLTGQLEGSYNQDRTNADTPDSIVEGFEGSVFGGVSRTFLNGMSMTARIGLDLARMLQPAHAFSSVFFGDASIAIPMLRGSGRHIAAEPLTQAEREALYAVWDFEHYKKEFAVQIAENYLLVLQAADQVSNQEENYRGLIASSRRASRLAEAGKTPQIQVDQSIQNELRARDRWVASREAFAGKLDQFKNLLGLPADSDLILDRRELTNLDAHINERLTHLFKEEEVAGTPPADFPVTLTPPGREERGAFELDPAVAVRAALANRLDLCVQTGRVYDAQRKVAVAADGLLPELTLLGSAAAGGHRDLSNASLDSSNELDFSRGVYQGLLTLDLPFERTAEANAYRDSYISLERAIRGVQELEDRIKLDVRDKLRNLEQARTSLKIQHQAVKLAERRVRGTELNLEAGRSEMRDLLESQEALLTAKNALTAAMVAYRIAELQLQRDLGVLAVDQNGLYQERSPEEIIDETNF